MKSETFCNGQNDAGQEDLYRRDLIGDELSKSKTYSPKRQERYYVTRRLTLLEIHKNC